MTTRTPDPVEYLRHITFPGNKGGLCVYAWHFAGNSWYELSTSVCSRDDQYDETLAEALVRDMAMEYRCIKMPLGSSFDIHDLSAFELQRHVDELFTLW